MRLLVTGVSTSKEVEQALKLGCHALGFDLTQDTSPTYTENLREIIKAMPPFVSKVGIFADNPRYEIEELVTFLDLDTLIFSGHESNDYLERWYGQKIIRTISSEVDILLTQNLVDAYVMELQTAEGCSRKITKPLIVTVTENDDLVKAKELAPWAVQVFCRTPLYKDLLDGRVHT